MKSELVKLTHLTRKAVVYVRQSTPHQVVSNQESLRLQYALRQRAHELGWHEADIDVIDADLGLSGASAAVRSGFKELVGRVSLSEVGLILSIDVTRLARNCSDWYPLLDICGLRGCLIADRDGVYDPGSANGRLLLGLKGTISELELHTIRSRLTAGLLAKAERGELALTLPIGLLRDPSGIVVKDPDLAVQERLELVFEMFLKFGAVAKVMRVLNEHGLDLPRRDHHGDPRWARATVASVASILKNPAYAGAFVYGRTRMHTPVREGAAKAKARRPIDEWRIVVKDRYPAYIDWPTYEKICAKIRDNRAEYMRIKTRGAPRDGELLLHGIAWCGRCGHKMFVRYKGGGQYVCNHLRSNEGLPTCQEMRAARIDKAVASGGRRRAARRFQRMVAEVCLGKVGAVCAREVSRFARNSRDWQQLIEMCRVINTVLVDQEMIYAPRHGNDRLLLGAKGSLDEYELDLLRQRSLSARYEKARRGELVVAAPIHEADKGDTTTLDPTLKEAEKNLSAVGLAPTPGEPCDLVADKGYHSRDVLKGLDDGPWKTRIAEPRPSKGYSRWHGDDEARAAVYGNRTRLKSGVGKEAMRKRGEIVERGFAHVLERGGMRRTWLRSRENVHKRYLIHVAGYNLGVMMRALFGAGTPREAANVRFAFLVTIPAADMIAFVMLAASDAETAALIVAVTCEAD